MSFEIKLAQFEGPFDLLLFFIERDELDIHDIPIAGITRDFLDYIHRMQTLNIELASEFILVAATLMRIKAKMLLPRPELDEEGNEIDPRQDLVQMLLEYKKYKSVLPYFQQLEEERLQQERRGNIAKELSVIGKQTAPGEELSTLDLYKLLKVYERVLKRYQNESAEVVHTVTQYPYNIQDQKEIILNTLTAAGKMNFEDILLLSRDKVQLVYNFLALLEMIQQQLVLISLGLGYNNFRLSLNKNGPE
ncbi:condensin subunit ScpA [Anseongella ginsenosidimutans]|uniref:Segregation and condensation protein A n=1 Tax=Anseongella ginsenosidimutans TaxID=496056 RepID=A0A4R3KMB8_9SPHI|nr:segregation/condensation protein A [Anseongella ginsenosidimutans]QEC54092.1 chromosome segregation protein ScpA [Anseongella ginsenosidimutans]TCS85136.1 condensin subunit ScpA [Anseongella ginsenosidimutans]